MSNVRNILYYSKKCKHSIDILNTLSRNANILNKFDLIDISNTKPPDYIKAVPSLLIPKPNGEADMLVGKSVFNWLNNILRSMNNQQQNNQQMNNQQMNNQQMNNQQMNNQQMNNQQMNNQQMNNHGNISDFDPCTMNGFSDNFSFIGNENNGQPIDHNFSFLNSNNNKLINEQQFSNSNNSNSGSKVKSDMEKAYERLMQSRDSEVPNPIQRC